MKFLQNLLKSAYPYQRLAPKHLEILDLLDSRLMQKYKLPTQSTNLKIYMCPVSFGMHLLSTEKIVDSLMRQLPEKGEIMPRSIALVSSTGTWYFLVGIRGDHEEETPHSLIMFSDAVTRTNSARSLVESVLQAEKQLS